MQEIVRRRLLQWASAGLAGRALGLASSNLLISAAIAAPTAQPAQSSLGIVTILDGKAQLLRGEERLDFVEGTRLVSQDVIETAADARLLRIEFMDGLAVNLGPSTRVLIDPQFYGERGRFAHLYLLSGWVKLKASAAPPAGQGDAAPIPLLASPVIDLLESSGAVVALVNEPALSLFVESGQAKVRERLQAKPLGEAVALRSGQFLQRAEQAKSTIAARPAPAFIDRIPRSFLDTLPDRAALFKGRDPTPKAIATISYADAKDWLDVEGTLRRPAMKRWRSLTRDAEFRRGLVADMPAHPEWDRVLFPEKYRPRQ
ncbi:MAG: hypothetical protein ABI564_00555 [Ideonella sp.]